ncbi:MAG: hypothetical protein HWN65_15855 [Candidatus Helarchaeota archaeon]|nr:hypothetical protein [Candidatus Helarchaeota archaeon]
MVKLDQNQLLEVLTKKVWEEHYGGINWEAYLKFEKDGTGTCIIHESKIKEAQVHKFSFTLKGDQLHITISDLNLEVDWTIEIEKYPEVLMKKLISHKHKLRLPDHPYKLIKDWLAKKAHAPDMANFYQYSFSEQEEQ